MLVAGQVGVVEGDLTASYHGDFEALVILEPVEELLEGHGALLDDDLVVVGVALRDAGDGAAHDRVELLRLVLNDIVRLGEHDLRQGQVDEAVLERLNVVLALDELEDLIADNTSDHGSGGGDGRDDLTSDHLSLVAVALSDGVVAGTKVGTSVDEINVEVGVIILLEVSRHKLAETLAEGSERLEGRSNGRLIIVRLGRAGRGGAASSLTLLLLLRSLDCDGLAYVLRRLETSSDLLDSILGDGWHAKIEENKVGASPHEVEVGLVIHIERLRSGAALGTGPEFVARAIKVILREEMEQVTDGEIVVAVEDFASLTDDTSLISSGLNLDKRLDSLKLSADTSRCGVLTEAGNESLRAADILAGILDTRAEESVELVAAPLDTVLNLVREVAERAHRDGLLRRILRIAVSLSLVRNDHLGVGLSAKSTGFEKRLLVPDALAINVETSLDVIDGVDNEVEALPELVIEHVFSLWGDKGLVSCNLEVRVHDLCLGAGSG